MRVTRLETELEELFDEYMIEFGKRVYADDVFYEAQIDEVFYGKIPCGIHSSETLKKFSEAQLDVDFGYQNYFYRETKELYGLKFEYALMTKGEDEFVEPPIKERVNSIIQSGNFGEFIAIYLVPESEEIFLYINDGFVKIDHRGATEYFDFFEHLDRKEFDTDLLLQSIRKLIESRHWLG